MPTALPGEALPVYATRPAPAASLRYRVQRGAAAGIAELDWQPEGGRYVLSLRTAWGGGAPGSGLTSRGAFDDAGLAPERQAETRRGREARAVNFRRDTGRVTYSGPSRQFPLPPGAQDRLSWMLQLAAIVDAEPGRATPGAVFSMWVFGPRGDADPWHFVVVGASRDGASDGAAAVSDTLLLRREPLRRFDPRVDVWLDPRLHHLPVRARMLPWPGGESTEFVLEQHTLR